MDEVDGKTMSNIDVWDLEMIKLRSITAAMRRARTEKSLAGKELKRSDSVRGLVLASASGILSAASCQRRGIVSTKGAFKAEGPVSCTVASSVEISSSGEDDNSQAASSTPLMANSRAFA